MSLEAQSLTATYQGRVVLDDVSLHVKRGEVLGILGANGAGKSTLLRLLAGLALPVKGQVTIDGAPLAGGAARHIAYLEQKGQSHWPLAVWRLVALGRMPHLGFTQRMGEADHAAIEQAMQETDVMHLRDRPMTALSAGEQARALLARALAVQPHVLLADEPVAGLDPAHQLAVMELLRQKAAQDMAVVAVLHDLPYAARFCDRVLLLQEGKAVALGRPEEVLDAEQLRKALQVEALTGTHEAMPYLLPWRAV